MPDRIDSKFRFILLAAERAEQMMRGARPKVETAQRKHSRIAMEEVVNDLLEWDYGPPPESEQPEGLSGEEGAAGEDGDD